jgi:hypothetical protein
MDLGLVYGLSRLAVELAIMLSPIGVAFLLGTGWWCLGAVIFALPAPLFILVPGVMWTLWALAWVCAALAVYERMRMR